jgi:hypothetical protein
VAITIHDSPANPPFGGGGGGAGEGVGIGGTSSHRLVLFKQGRHKAVQAWIQNSLAVPEVISRITTLSAGGSPTAYRVITSKTPATEDQPKIADVQRVARRAARTAYNTTFQSHAHFPTAVDLTPPGQQLLPLRIDPRRRADRSAYEIPNRLSLPLDLPIQPSMPDRALRARRATPAAYGFENRTVQPGEPIPPPARFDVSQPQRRAPSAAYFVSSGVPPESAPISPQFIGVDSPDVVRRAKSAAYAINTAVPPEEPQVPPPSVAEPKIIRPRPNQAATWIDNLLAVPETMPAGQSVQIDRAYLPRRASVQDYWLNNFKTIDEFPAPTNLQPEFARGPRRLPAAAYQFAVRHVNADPLLSAGGGPRPYRPEAVESEAVRQGAVESAYERIESVEAADSRLPSVDEAV